MTNDPRSLFRKIFKAISDSDFMHEMLDKIDHYKYKDYHIQAIYFIQHLVIQILFFKLATRENDSWIRWIGKLTKEELIPFLMKNLIL